MSCVTGEVPSIKNGIKDSQDIITILERTLRAVQIDASIAIQRLQIFYAMISLTFYWIWLYRIFFATDYSSEDNLIYLKKHFHLPWNFLFIWRLTLLYSSSYYYYYMYDEWSMKCIFIKVNFTIHRTALRTMELK